MGTNEPVKIFLRDAYSAMKLSEIRVQIFLFKLDIMMEKKENSINISFRYLTIGKNQHISDIFLNS